ncbi:MAG: peptidase S41 [Chlorobi bacterium]|nr:peptidase S41 [Chlorobiota bacterium]
MKKFFVLLTLAFFAAQLSFAQINARLFQYPDVSETQIVFTYAGDIWVVDKDGGTANKLSSPKGEEYLAKFSPDGKSIAFTGDYDGNEDIYEIPADGGLVKRITYHSSVDRMLDWTPDGKDVLFASARESGRQRFSRLFTIDADGGLAKILPVPYGEFAAISPDGKTLAFTPRTRLFRTWKRYRGGMAADIWLFNLETYKSKNITDDDANSEMPMWSGGKLYFLTDKGENERYNIWVYDVKSGDSKQVTFFDKFDVHFPSIGPKDIVFEAGGELYLLDLSTEKYSPVKIEIIADQIALHPVSKNVKKYVTNACPSPDGNRLLIQARGEIFSLPAKEGVTYDLTNTSGAAERYPAWSPDGKLAAYWSDASGEYELYLKDLKSDKPAEKLTSTGAKFKYNLFWSPDNNKLAFIDNAMNIRIYDLKKKEFINADKALYKYQGSLEGFTVRWSPDGRYITYSRGLENQHEAIFIFDVTKNELHQVTSGYYGDSDPVFDAEGKYLFYVTDRHFSPTYGSVNNNFIYNNTAQLAAVALTPEIKSPLAPKNDSVEMKKKKDSDKKDEKKEDKEKDKKKETKIDFNNFEERVVILPPEAGRYYNLQTVKGKLVYQKTVRGEKTTSPIAFYDLKEREEKTIVDDAGSYEITADGKKALVSKKNNFYLIDIKEKQKLKDAVPLDGLRMTVNPKEEWKQIFNDAWRLERDYFYDPNMHGVNWNEVRERYGKLVDFAATRYDLNFLIGEMIGELSSSHTYKGGGDMEKGKRLGVGYLGINWAAEDGHFKIAKIIRGGKWDAEVRSPFDLPDVNVKEGDFILAVNGVPMDVSKEPYAAFAGLAGKTVELTVNDKPSFEDAKKVVVKTLKSESRLRHLAWIEKNRKTVDELSGGKIGYIYVRSTGVDGQNELVRQYLAQVDKEGLIIDERFNSGGQIPDRFIELLNKKPLAYWAVRDGKNWNWPPNSQFGPKAMLINGWSGSGGDAFPDFFRKAGLGKIIGMRTWGGLIGITGAPNLIDGGMITVPTFRMFNPDGTWFKEGHGVDPDIKVVDDPTLMAKGKDPQLEKAVEVVMSEIKTAPQKPKQPPYEKR